MKSLKKHLGRPASAIVNQMLRANISREKKSGLVNFVNNHPNWFIAVDRKILAQTNFGFPIWCDRWDVIGQTIIATGQWEELLSRTILAILKPGDFAIDIGANMGYDSMLMSVAVGAKGTVLAFEPDLKNLSALLENIKHLEHNNVIVQCSALSNSPGLTRMSLADDSNLGTSNLRPDEAGRSQPVLVTRLDTLLDGAVQNRIRFLKMDIEGFEYKAIMGMGGLLEQIDCLTCEISPDFLTQCGGSAEEIFRSLVKQGFKSYCAEPSSKGKWVKSDHNYKIQAAHSHPFDALFCREVSDSLRPLIADLA